MDDITSLVEDVVRFEEKKQRFAENLRENPPQLENGRDAGFIHTVSRHELDQCTVAGVDGGLKQRALHGLDLVLTRAVAAVFTYRNASLDGYEYVPASNPSPDTEVIRTPLERHDFRISASLKRMQTEASTLHTVLTREDTDLALLDGSIVPHYADKPGSDSRARQYYDTLINQYEDVFTAAEKNGLAGVVEDSRGTHLCDLLQDTVDDPNGILRQSRDTDLLTHVLEPGERTTILPYTETPEDHPTLSDLPGHGDNIYMFYLKTVARDRPIRIDFYAKEDPVETGERVASLVYTLSQGNAQYGLPAPIIEADKRAALTEHDLKLVEGKLRSRLDLTGLQSLRRENRPF